MLNQTGFDGMICADHLIRPHRLSSPYPTGAGAPPWALVGAFAESSDASVAESVVAHVR